MITYKELQQILQPIEDQNQSQQPNNNTHNQGQPNNNAAGSRKYSLNISHRQLRKIPPAIPFKQYQIERLDMSFNYLKDLKSFKQQTSTHLEYLNVSFNFLTSIEKLGHLFPNLTVIDANANRIVSVQIKDNQFPALQALFLKNNKIKYFLHCPNTLQILCLDHNQLDKLAFTGGENLQILTASTNKIQQFEIQQCEKLNFIDLEENKINDLQKLKLVIKKCKNLLSLNLIGNYVSKIAHKRYLIQVLTTCPILVKVDEVIINPHVREAFKIMAQEDKMEQNMKQTEQRYKNRMLQQLKLKQQLIENLKNQEKKIQDQFVNFLNNQKQQLDALQNYAKNNMGKKKLGIVSQNKQFNKKTNIYNSQAQKPFPQNTPQQNAKTKALQNVLSSMKKDPKEESNQPSNIAQELTKYLVQGIIINKHKDQYKQFKKNKQQQRISKQSKIKKYLGIPEKDTNSKIQKDVVDIPAEQDQDSFTILSNDQEDQLSFEQKQRRKKNMRNPGLVYRNSNQLIGAPPINIDQDIKSDGEETVFNKKCLPYLVKNYGFHTVV